MFSKVEIKNAMKFSLMVTVIALCILVIPKVAFAKGNIALTINGVTDERSWGMLGDYEKDFESWEFAVDSQLQSGDITRGKYNASVAFDLWLIQLKPYLEGKVRGHSLNSVGYSQSVGAAINVPIDSLDIGVGVFGKNASPFKDPSALDILVSKGFNQTKLEELNLGDIYADPTGLTLDTGNSINALVYTHLDWSNVEIDLEALFEIAGDGERVHQASATFSTGWNPVDKLQVSLIFDIAGQLYGNTIQYETAFLTSVGYPF